MSGTSHIIFGARARQEATRRTWGAVMDGLLNRYEDAIASHSRRPAA